MPWWDIIKNDLLGAALVAAVLIALALVIKALYALYVKAHGGKIQEAGGDTPAGEAVPAVQGELKLTGVDEKTAALIMAIVSHESGIPLGELNFHKEHRRGGGRSIMKYIVKINNNNYEVEVERGKATVVKTSKAAAAAAAVTEVKAALQPAAAPAPAAATAAQGQVLSAPMPGIVLQVKKSVGDSVKKGDVVIVLEAMKMESEITSPYEGTITQIPVAKGAHVNAGDVLAVIG